MRAFFFHAISPLSPCHLSPVSLSTAVKTFGPVYGPSFSSSSTPLVSVARARRPAPPSFFLAPTMSHPSAVVYPSASESRRHPASLLPKFMHDPTLLELVRSPVTSDMVGTRLWPAARWKLGLDANAHFALFPRSQPISPLKQSRSSSAAQHPRTSPRPPRRPRSTTSPPPTTTRPRSRRSRPSLASSSRSRTSRSRHCSARS